MATSRRGSFQRGRAPRRLTNWGAGPGGTTAVTVTDSAASLLGAGVTFGSAGTVVRIRGRFTANLTVFAAIANGYTGAIGIGLASEAAFDVGIGSLPTPLTEEKWDGWLWHTFFNAHAGASGASSVSSAFDMEVDTKAMRKVSDEMVIYAAAEVVRSSGAATMQMFLNSRMLIKEG